MLCNYYVITMDAMRLPRKQVTRVDVMYVLVLCVCFMVHVSVGSAEVLINMFTRCNSLVVTQMMAQCSIRKE